jgi:hypothetical protein
MYYPSMLQRILLLLCIVSMLDLGVTSAQPASNAETFALELLTRIKAQDFQGASRMFHYPESQSNSERETDRSSVARWLETLSKELDRLRSVKPQRAPQGTETVVSLSIAGGDVPYWTNRGPIDTLVYSFKASFGKEPDGRLSVYVMRKDRAWEIQSLHFGVLATRPDAKRFMAVLARRLLP